MCNLSDGVLQKGYDRGIEKGIETAILASIQNLMATLHFSAEQAMDALKVPEQDRQKYYSSLPTEVKEKQDDCQ